MKCRGQQYCRCAPGWPAAVCGDTGDQEDEGGRHVSPERAPGRGRRQRRGQGGQGQVPRRQQADRGREQDF